MWSSFSSVSSGTAIMKSFAESHPVLTTVSVATVFGSSAFFVVTRKTSKKMNQSLFSVNSKVDAKTSAGKYSDIYADKEDKEKRKKEYFNMVDSFYNLVTDFYLFGWGERFHFAPRQHFESFDESLRRHEYWLATQLGIKEGTKVLDCGCGVGGPARTLARFSKAEVTGISLNKHQIELGQKQNEKEGLSHLVKLYEGNFMELPFPDNYFDVIYDIEATCHAPDHDKCYKELCRVLKPGGIFGSYAWVTRPPFDRNNPEHDLIKYNIELTNGLPELETVKHYEDALERNGFNVDWLKDVADDPVLSPLPWYQPFLDGWLTTPFAISVTNVIVYILEKLRILPKGTHFMHGHLYLAATTLLEGGQKKIFTPMQFIKATKKKSVTQETSH